MKPTFLTAVLLTAIVAQPLRAQDAGSPLSLIPADAMFVHWCDGPKTLREAFADTRVAELLGGPELSLMLNPMLDEARDEARGGGIDVDALEDALLDYEGRFVLAGGFDADRVDDLFMDFEEQMEAAAVWAVCVLSSDGHSDLAGLQEKLTELIEDSADNEVGDLEVDGRSFRASFNDRGFNVTVPFMEGPNLVMVFGAPLEEALSRFMSRQGQSLQDRQLNLPRSEVGVWMDPQPLWPLIDMAAEANDPTFAEFLDASGLKSIGTIALHATASDEHVIVDFDVQLNGDDQGVLACITDVGADQASLLDVVPVQRKAWSVTKVNFGAFYESIMDIFSAMEPVTAMSSDDMLDQFAEMFRVRLKEDLIDHLGDELLLVQGDEPADFDEMGAGQAQCYGISLRDAKSFDASFETLLRSRGMHAARKTEDYRGFTVRKLTVLGMLELHYTVTDRLFLVGITRAGAAELRAVLDEEKGRNEGSARAGYPDEIAQRLEHTGDDWQSLAVQSLSSTIEMVMAMMEQAGELPPSAAAQVQSASSMIMGLLNRYRLDTLVSVAKANGGSVKTRTIW